MIPLYVVDGKAYVWNDKDWYELRTKHRICGVLVGSIPSKPRQNEFLGFPMILLAEEAAMLSLSGVCELLEVTNLTTKPNADLTKTAQRLQDKCFEEQMKFMKENRIEQLSQKIDLIVAGKRKKLISKGEPFTEEALGRDALLQQEIDKLPYLTKPNSLIQIPTQFPQPMECKKLKVKDLAGLDKVKFAVYKDLYSRGHYITTGSKFGGDFLVYPGEPIKFHASYIVRCVPCERTAFRPAELVAFGRLAVAVNKCAALAALVDDEVRYQTVRWHDAVAD